MKQERSIVVTVTVEPECQLSHKGVPWCKLVGITKDQRVLEFMAFYQTAQTLSTDVKVGMSVSLAVAPSSKGDKAVISAYHIQELNKAGSALNHVSKTDLREFRAYQAKQGLVPARRSEGVIWKHRDDCLLIDKTWYEKIEVIMQMLGGPETSKRIKEAGVGVSLSGKNASLYREWRESQLRELGY